MEKKAKILLKYPKSFTVWSFLGTDSRRERGMRNMKEAALQAPRSVQKESRVCSRHRAAAPSSPGGASGGAGCALQPLGTTWSRSSCAVMEEPTGQQRMRLGGGTALGYPGLELQPMDRGSWWGRRAGGSCHL